jgi:hypothetical protein
MSKQSLKSKYPLSYELYWTLKTGEYGIERVRRVKERRKKRYARRHEKNKLKWWGPWIDHNSPTGYSMKCDVFGTCQYPCNGDC